MPTYLVPIVNSVGTTLEVEADGPDHADVEPLEG